MPWNELSNGKLTRDLELRMSGGEINLRLTEDIYRSKILTATGQLQEVSRNKDSTESTDDYTIG
jgi:hypothetical protein